MNDLLQTRMFGLLSETSQEVTNEEMQNAYLFLCPFVPIIIKAILFHLEMISYQKFHLLTKIVNLYFLAYAVTDSQYSLYLFELQFHLLYDHR